MFMDLTEPLKEGQTLKGTLLFEKAGAVTVEYAVRGIAARGEAEHPARPLGPQGREIFRQRGELLRTLRHCIQSGEADEGAGGCRTNLFPRTMDTRSSFGQPRTVGSTLGPAARRQ